jgi:hypothetical protein
MSLTIVDLQTYFKKNFIEKFNNTIDPTILTFEHSKDDGIYLDLKDGKYLLSVGKSVSYDQANRVLTVIYMDTTLGVKNEDERLAKGYSEFSTAVAKQKTKFFPPTHGWVEIDGKLVKDKIIEEFKTQCQMEKAGKIDKTKIYGLKPKEIRLTEKS